MFNPVHKQFQFHGFNCSKVMDILFFGVFHNNDLILTSFSGFRNKICVFEELLSHSRSMQNFSSLALSGQKL